MQGKRWKHPVQFKAKVAFESINGETTNAELQFFGVHPIRSQNRRKKPLNLYMIYFQKSTNGRIKTGNYLRGSGAYAVD